MSKVAIVTDSTAYVPAELIQQYNMRVAPQVLIWGDETLRDGVDIQPDEFYKRLSAAKVMPTTSQVSIGDFKKIFGKLVEQDYEILAVLISEKLSGTISSAVQAKSAFPNAAIEIFNSNTTAMALGFLALTAARAAQQGASLQDCKQLMEQSRDKVGVVFAVDTLEFLHRGGRIGGASRFLGTALNIKPILEVRDGRVEPLEKVRTRRKALNRLVELIDQRTQGHTSLRLASLHANAEPEARKLLETASKHLNSQEDIFTSVSPVVGCHAGPGTVGLAYLVDM